MLERPHRPGTPTDGRDTSAQRRAEGPPPASVLSGDPCREALTPDQLTQILGISPPGKRDDTAGLGPACDWNNSDTGAGVAVNYVTEPHQGLSGLYANTKPQVKTWRELPPVQGFPAVAHASDEATTFCQVSTGIRDDLSFDTSLFLSSGKIGNADSCALAARVADLVVTNLRQKAGS